MTSPRRRFAAGSWWREVAYGGLVLACSVLAVLLEPHEDWLETVKKADALLGIDLYLPLVTALFLLARYLGIPGASGSGEKAANASEAIAQAPETDAPETDAAETDAAENEVAPRSPGDDGLPARVFRAGILLSVSTVLVFFFDIEFVAAVSEGRLENQLLCHESWVEVGVSGYLTVRAVWTLATHGQDRVPPGSAP